MNTEAEIHAINNKLSEIITAIEVIKERRSDDKEDNHELKNQLADVLIAVNRLNLIVAKADGKSEGISTAVKVFRTLIGAIVFIVIVSYTATLIDLYARVAVIEAGMVQ